jgi:hypothetical protein
LAFNLISDEIAQGLLILTFAFANFSFSFFLLKDSQERPAGTN